MVFENRVLRRIFGPKREEVMNLQVPQKAENFLAS
jgi:hypothetical protein